MPRPHHPGIHLVLATLLLAPAACGDSVDNDGLHDFAAGYAAAWSGQDPEALAAYYTDDGSLIVNGGTPATGRAAITETARSYMEAFPDMRVVLDSLGRDGDRVVFHWTWTGTNTGPGGTGRAVRLSGYERWLLNDEGRIIESDGHFDEAEYRRQLGVE